MRVLNTEQMREADRRTIVDVGVPSIDLMEQAGHEVVEALDATFDDLEARRIVVVCGRGNNGGADKTTDWGIWELRFCALRIPRVRPLFS